MATYLKLSKATVRNLLNDHHPTLHENPNEKDNHWDCSCGEWHAHDTDNLWIDHFGDVLDEEDARQFLARRSTNPINHG